MSEVLLDTDLNETKTTEQFQELVKNQSQQIQQLLKRIELLENQSTMEYLKSLPTQLNQKLTQRFQHLKEKNLCYFSHLKQAWGLAFRASVASFMLVIHGLYPDCWTLQAGDRLIKVSQDLQQMRTTN